MRRSLAVAASRRVSAAPFRCLAGASRAYQGGLTDKDRIYTNLYNDGSPYLEGAKKRVRQQSCLHPRLCQLALACACARPTTSDAAYVALHNARARGRAPSANRLHEVLPFATAALL